MLSVISPFNLIIDFLVYKNGFPWVAVFFCIFGWVTRNKQVPLA